MIYLFFRTTDTVVYQIFQLIISDSSLIKIRDFLQENQTPSWFIYNLPGGLWIFAFANACFLFLSDRQCDYSKKIIAILFSIVCLLEFMQLIHLTDGRFDFLDLLVYALASLGSYLLVYKRVQNHTHHSIFNKEKNPFYAIGFLISLFIVSIYLADVQYKI